MGNPKFEQAVRDAEKAIRPLMRAAFDAGHKAGAEEARDRILRAALGAPDAKEASPSEAKPKKLRLKSRPKKSGKQGLRPGSMNYKVYNTMKKMDHPPEGVNADQVQEACSDRGHDFEILQIRTALKQLERSNYLTRVERGFYALKGETPSEDQSEGASNNTGEVDASPNESRGNPG